MQDEVIFYKKQAEYFEQRSLYLEQQLEHLKRLIYGVKSEKFIPQQHPSQIALNLGAEAAIEQIEFKAQAVTAHQRGGNQKI